MELSEQRNGVGISLLPLAGLKPVNHLCSLPKVWGAYLLGEGYVTAYSGLRIISAHGLGTELGDRKVHILLLLFLLLKSFSQMVRTSLFMLTPYNGLFMFLIISFLAIFFLGKLISPACSIPGRSDRVTEFCTWSR